MSENQISSWCETLGLVPAQWRADFVRFIEEGEASEEFIDFLESNADCRRACEMTFRADRRILKLLNALGEEYFFNGNELAANKPLKQPTHATPLFRSSTLPSS